MQVDLKINSVHFHAKEELTEFVQRRIDKLAQFYDRIIDGEVFLKVENNAGEENKIAEIRLRIPGHDLFAKKQCKTFEEATDTAVEALRRQLRKHKTRQRAIA